jgi:hypothetical protein
MRSRIAIESDGVWRPTLVLIALLKNAFAAATSRLLLSRKSTVWPALSTAR